MKEWNTPDSRFRERIREMLRHQAFLKHIGFEITEIEPGRVGGSMAFRDFHYQQFGILHGGVIMTLADVVAGFAAYTLAAPDQDVVTAEIKVSCFRPGKGDKVRAEGWVVKPGRHIIFAEAEVYCTHEEREYLVARASTTMSLIPKERFG